VAGAGDVNGDGYDDLIVGTPNTSSGGHSYGGSASVFQGERVGGRSDRGEGLRGGRGGRCFRQRGGVLALVAEAPHQATRVSVVSRPCTSAPQRHTVRSRSRAKAL